MSDSNSDDFYKILGVSRSASQAEIKHHYRKLAMRWHPDKNMENKQQAEERFKKISEAYAVLSNLDQKQQYDMFGRQGSGQAGQGQGQGRSGMSFNDAENVFNMFFNGGGSGQQFTFGGGGGGGFGASSRQFNARHSNMSEGQTLFDTGEIFGRGMGHRGNRGAHETADDKIGVIANGTRVILKGLVGKKELNRHQGVVKQWCSATGRYTISLQGGLLALKRLNLFQMIPVRVRVPGGESKQTLVGWKDTEQRFVVRCPQGKVSGVDPSDLSLPEGCSVYVRKLRTNPTLNGKLGSVLRFEDGRYLVAIDKGHILKLLPKNVDV